MIKLYLVHQPYWHFSYYYSWCCFFQNGNFNVLGTLRYYLISPSNNSVQEAALSHIVEENDGRD